jgi:hypothetical protein
MREQPRDQLGSRIDDLVLALRRVGGQQHAGLDPGERGRHEEIFRGHVQIELLHELDVLEVLLCDACDRNLGNVHLVEADEMKQQVEGAFEDGQLDGVRCPGLGYQGLEGDGVPPGCVGFRHLGSA